MKDRSPRSDRTSSPARVRSDVGEPSEGDVEPSVVPFATPTYSTHRVFAIVVHCLSAIFTFVCAVKMAGGSFGVPHALFLLFAVSPYFVVYRTVSRVLRRKRPEPVVWIERIVATLMLVFTAMPYVDTAFGRGGSSTGGLIFAFMPIWLIGGGVMAISFLSAFVADEPASCCTRCGYNLRGNITGRCPECGAKVFAAPARLG